MGHPEYDRVPVLLTPLDLRGVPADGLAAKMPRPSPESAFPTVEVREILEAVRRDGDGAIRVLTERFDGVAVESLRVPPAAVAAARDGINDDLGRALELANDRILAYHRHEPAPVGDFVLDGVTVRHLVRAVGRAGLYAPGGLARYPSTVLMCAAPARVAGVDELVLCVPPGPDGRVATETLAAAAIAGIDEVYAVGAPRPSEPWPTGPSPSVPWTSSWAPAIATWPRPNGRWRASSASPRPSPGPRRWWSWPTTRPP